MGISSTNIRGAHFSSVADDRLGQDPYGDPVLGSVLENANACSTRLASSDGAVGEEAATMTERQRRVMAVWNWLPAVRVVAEYESIQRAARELAVSPSALSRTIKLAEDAVGAALFVRAASGITLTEAGATLLRSEERRVGKECVSTV